MPHPTVAIIGAGIGGVYLAAELGTLGCSLRLTDLDDSRLIAIREHGGLEVEPGGFAAIERVTPDPAAVVEGAEVIAVCTGGTHQESVATGLAPLLRDNQIILLIQGNTGGALAFRRVLDAAGCTAAVDIAEMDNYPIRAGGRRRPRCDHRAEEISADRGVSGKPHRCRVCPPVTAVSSCGGGPDGDRNRFYECQCDVARR